MRLGVSNLTFIVMYVKRVPIYLLPARQYSQTRERLNDQMNDPWFVIVYS